MGMVMTVSYVKQKHGIHSKEYQGMKERLAMWKVYAVDQMQCISDIKGAH